ncbi:MAG: DedA family protein [Gemmatimonadetes bacterium]|jgi:membrane protein DedA with SNARE-associated domain|nr:DedA family protein [Gemmatimonadota bacterium]MDE0962903.1 DedA family protein [Candidatus Latescibacterota bacterium]MBT5328209.1 DedA family protein [Gemmatimonadota bacterium]MBT5450607.1 DedA family protein [Gemmatimonadota bacterium]MBT5805550.1 DedA family protein [Gemmatimonadota bacterium]
MAAYLESLIAELSGIDPIWAYCILLLSAFLENVIPPVPGDTVVVFSAYLVGRGTLGLWPVFLTTWIGGTAGFLGMYYLGYSRGRAFFTSRGGRFFSLEGLAKAEYWLQRYGVILLLGNRFLSGIRSVIAIGAGLGGMKWMTVAVCGAISTAVWNGLLLYAGLMVGQNWEQVTGLLKQYNIVLLGLLLLLVVVFLWRWWAKRS